MVSSLHDLQVDVCLLWYWYHRYLLFLKFAEEISVVTDFFATRTNVSLLRAWLAKQQYGRQHYLGKESTAAVLIKDVFSPTASLVGTGSEGAGQCFVHDLG
jgi:hypothetical protein